MNEDLKQKPDDELWTMWGAYISAAGRIKREIDRRKGAPIRQINPRKRYANKR
jgi:hypothetical protein